MPESPLYWEAVRPSILSSNLKIIPFPITKPVGEKIHRKSCKLQFIDSPSTEIATFLMSIHNS